MAPDVAATTAAREDAELMRRVQTGDEAALEARMERWELPVKSVIGRIVLNANEQMSQAEIALVVGASPKAVETRIHRARERLRARLKAWQ